jgi:hypothetical protein
LFTQSKSISVRHPGAAVSEDAGAVDGVDELVLGLAVLGHDDVRVAAAELVNVLHGILKTLDNLKR